MTTTRGDRVVQLREAHGWTQTELAERVTRLLDKPETVYPETLSRIERRRNETSVGMLAALAQALDTTADYLLGLTDDPSIPTLPRYPIPAPELYAAIGKANLLDLGQRIMVGQVVSLIVGALAQRNAVQTEVAWLVDLWQQVEDSQQAAARAYLETLVAPRAAGSAADRFGT